ncbi:MAG: HD domain-containing protein [Treponema sp.]|jgi:HD-GYP domain-containing protein (c-di-GMP phosphodiesterase class II)|nr:HD domain-containing protein [Treponema sp.]
MNIRMDKLIKAIAEALDIVEGELLGATTHHGKRVAVLAAAVGQRFGMNGTRLQALTVCALMHDNALTEYILAEREGNYHDPSMKLHCEYGQKNIDTFNLNADGYILYHHERADGKGPYKKRTNEIPLGAAIIAIADTIDVTHHLQTITPAELPRIHKNITGGIGTKFAADTAEALLDVLDEEMLFSLKDDSIVAASERFIRPWIVDIESDFIMKLTGFITHIIDYKSKFTKTHCAGIAEKARRMSIAYRYSGSLRAQFYLAAALHDIGKLATPTGILEKPGPLTREEFGIIKEHVHLTYKLLKDIDGLENISVWAYNHHEKLDGSGYYFGKKADELDFNSRLLACLDIYQALTEERPYHAGKDHRAAMEILFDMGRRGLLDSGIISDLDAALPGV